MGLEIKGLDHLQKQMEEAGHAFETLNGEIATIKFDPEDSASVELAIADMRQAIDLKVEPYAGNPIVTNMAEQLKSKYETEILGKATEAKAETPTGMVDEKVFRQIQNIVADLRQADRNAFQRQILKLSSILHGPELGPFSAVLTEKVSVQAFLQEGNKSRGSMVGSGKLEWPTDPKDEMGIVIELIDLFAHDSDAAPNIAYTFWHAGNSFTNSLQKMVTQVIVPFARDFTQYVRDELGSRPFEGNTVRKRSPAMATAARKAFVVHGHDEGARETVARFLERIDIQPIILHEQANQGKTLIEKFEAHSEVGFAIVLLTPDDEGGAKGKLHSPRARQNVILELGYFIGLLGRDRVCALRKGDTEIPSDFAGVVYQTFDAGGGWKVALAKELRAAGIDIDMNKI